MNKEKQKTVGRSAGKGFTLVELIVAVGIFALLMVLSVGALLAIVSANKNAQGIRSAVDNLNFSLETMARTIRTGSNYNCNGGDCSGGTSLSFTDQSGSVVTYRKNGGEIDRIYNGAVLAMTAPEVTINRLNFYVNGAASGDKVQPNVLIIIDGTVNYKGVLSTGFNIETLAVQRYFNK